MDNENIIVEMQDFNLQDKVRLIAFRTFNSKVFLAISVLFTLAFFSSVVDLFLRDFNFTNLISIIISLIMLIGVWKTYIMAKGERVIDTSGLRLIRSIINLGFILLIIGGSLLLLLTLIEGIAILIIDIPIAILCFSYYVFKQALTNIISAFEEGNTNTDYYSGAAILLVIGVISLIIANIILLSFSLDWLPGMTYELVNRFTDGEKKFIIINLVINTLLFSLMAYLIYRFKNNLSDIYIYYPKDNTNVNNIEYKISSKILESDKEINDRGKYDE